MIGWWLTAMVVAGTVLVIVNVIVIFANSEPWRRVPDISHISIEDLKMVGVQGILFDADNTLTAYHKNELHPDIKESFLELSKAFKVAVFTNTWSEERHKKLHGVFTGIPIVSYHHKKPNKDGFVEAAKLLSLHPSRMVMVGDRVTTDILGGNKAGMKTILVTRPLSDGKEPSWYPVLRRFEHILFE